MSQESQHNDFAKAVALTGATAAVWMKAVTHRNGGSRQLRTALKLVHFRSRARVPEEPLATFCQRFSRAGEGASEQLQVPWA